MPYGAQRLYVLVAHDLFARLAPRPMTRLAVRMSAMHIERTTVLRHARVAVLLLDKWIAAVRAEKVRLVVRPWLAKGVDRDEPLVHNRRLAVEAPPRKQLVKVKVAVWLALVLIERYML